MMDKVFTIERLDDLEKYLLAQDREIAREYLQHQFLNFADYKNVTERNKAVRICECLAIVGRGTMEALEAQQGISFNGNPTTSFYNKDNEPRFVDAIWSKRKNGLTMELGRTCYHESPDLRPKKTILHDYPVVEQIEDWKLSSQRNRIIKNPIAITRTISNCYENSKSVIESIWTKLWPLLNSKMQPKDYGKAINRIVFKLSFSYITRLHCKTNLIIADESLKLRHKDFYPTLLTLYSKKEIQDNGYFLRNRFEYGTFQSQTGTIKTTIHFEKEFSEMSHEDQKKMIIKYITIALSNIGEKLKKKKIEYNFDLLIDDFRNTATEWIKQS